MAATDDYSTLSPGLNSPCSHVKEVTLHDTNDLEHVSRYVYVGGAGNLKVITLGGDTETIKGITAGSLLPIRITRAFSTGSTATNVSIFW